MKCKGLFIKSIYINLLINFLALLLEKDTDSVVILNVKKYLKFLHKF